MPTIFQDRCGISLHDAQYSSGKKAPIPDVTIRDVVAALLRFKCVCEDFSVPKDNIRVVATEATRIATNSQVYRDTIEKETGWMVELLSKEEEGRLGALGVASSFFRVCGLVMDLGGGSVQLSWMTFENGEIECGARGSISLPYGAAALKILMAEAKAEGKDLNLVQRVRREIGLAIKDLPIPPKIMQIAKESDGLKLYLTGGGFRGFGYILMASHALHPYPIPIINGFQAPISQLKRWQDDGFFRVSPPQFRLTARRVSQVPAVFFLISAIDSVIGSSENPLPRISTIHFAQGGIREGLLFSTLPPFIRAQHPLSVAALSNNSTYSDTLIPLLRSGIPQPNPVTDEFTVPPLPPFLSAEYFLTTLLSLVNFHASHPKDIRAAAALRSTTTGVLASTHGLSHSSRALVALALCERWESELILSDAEFQRSLEILVGKKRAWWAKYMGCILAGIGYAYPAGTVVKGRERLELSAGLRKGTAKQNGVVVEVKVRLEKGSWASGGGGEESAWVGELRKLGKRKNFIGGEGNDPDGDEGLGGYGFGVEVDVEWSL